MNDTPQGDGNGSKMNKQISICIENKNERYSARRRKL